MRLVVFIPCRSQAMQSMPFHTAGFGRFHFDAVMQHLGSQLYRTPMGGRWPRLLWLLWAEGSVSG